MDFEINQEVYTIYFGKVEKCIIKSCDLVNNVCNIEFYNNGYTIFRNNSRIFKTKELAYRGLISLLQDDIKEKKKELENLYKKITSYMENAGLGKPLTEEELKNSCYNNMCNRDYSFSTFN